MTRCCDRCRAEVSHTVSPLLQEEAGVRVRNASGSDGQGELQRGGQSGEEAWKGSQHLHSHGASRAVLCWLGQGEVTVVDRPGMRAEGGVYLAGSEGLADC